MKLKLPHIEWTISPAYFTSPEDDGVTYHYAEGASDDGRVWVGRAVFVFGELEEIIDIENP